MYLIRRLFHKHWYTICSAHRKPNRKCSRCKSGHWVINRWRVEKQARDFRSYRAAAIQQGVAVDTGPFYQEWVKRGRPARYVSKSD